MTYIVGYTYGDWDGYGHTVVFVTSDRAVAEKWKEKFDALSGKGTAIDMELFGEGKWPRSMCHKVSEWNEAYIDEIEER